MKVLYTGAFRFPDKDAAAKRVFSIAKLFEAEGCEVDFAGWESRSDNIGEYNYYGHKCYSMAEFREKKQNLTKRIFNFVFRGKNTLLWLINNRNYDVVVVYNPPAVFSAVILIISKIYKFRLVLDNTEWYESEHLPGGKYGLAAFENWCRMHFLYRLFTNVICISTFLYNRANKNDKNVVLIRPI